MIEAQKHRAFALPTIVAVFVLAVVATVLFTSERAGAVYQPGANFHYLVSRGSTNEILSSQVTVYYPGDIRSSGGTRAVLVRTDACFRNGAGGTMTGGTRVLTAAAGSVSATWTGRECTDHTVRTLNVPSNRFAYMSDINMSYVTLTVTTPDSYPSGYTLKLIGFRVDPGADGIVAQRAGQQTGYRGYENSGDNGDFHSMSIPFAPACGVSGNGRITIYDPDQDYYPQTANGPTGQLPERRWRKIDFWVEDSGGHLSRSEYTDVSGRMTWQSGAREWRPSVSADRSGVWVEADFSSTDNYELHIQDINTINGISVQLPYDEIYGRVDCEDTDSDYSLVPTIGVTPGSVVQPSDIAVDPSVAHSGSVASRSTSWQISRFVLANGTSSPIPDVASSSSGQDPCTYITNEIAGRCSSWMSGTKVFSSSTNDSGSTRSLDSQNDTVSGYGIGQQVCYMLSVSRPTESSVPLWRHSAPVCVKIVYVPTVEVHGNDLRVGSGFIGLFGRESRVVGLLSSTSSSYVGSWSEYSLLSTGDVTNVASGSGLNGTRTDDNSSGWSRLTFANTGGTLGRYSTSLGMGSIPGVEEYFSSDNTRSRLGGIVDIQERTALNVSDGIYRANTVYLVEGTATISSDIAMPSSFANARASSFPQMVIVANNINITENVRRIDAWLIARDGTVNTCYRTGNQSLSSEICNSRLTINGPVMAESLLLRRTAGDGPAEIVNLRGDAYIWMTRLAERSGHIRTTNLRELPPRY